MEDWHFFVVEIDSELFYVKGDAYQVEMFMEEEVENCLDYSASQVTDPDKIQQFEDELGEPLEEGYFFYEVSYEGYDDVIVFESDEEATEYAMNEAYAHLDYDYREATDAEVNEQEFLEL